MSNEGFYGIISLQLGRGEYFAIVGGREKGEKFYGEIKIGEIMGDFSVIFHKKYLYSNKFCYFKSILEIVDGVIIVGGSHKCDAICIWNIWRTINHIALILNKRKNMKEYMI